MGSESKGLSSLSSSSLSLSWSPRTKKIIQNLKEIVDSPESEIYDVLVECNMNPDEAVQRLLTQDTFHEVKSRRERRKKMTETQESKSQAGYNGSSGRGIGVANERSFGYNRGSYNDNGNYTSHLKEENMSVASSPPPPYFMSHVKGDTLTQQPSTFDCGGSTGEPERRCVVVSSTVQPSLGCQPPLSGTSSAHLSIADIVRMDRATMTNVPETVDESDINSFLDDQTATVVSNADKDSKHSNGDRSEICESTNSHDVEAPERNLSNRNFSSDHLVVMDSVSNVDSEGYYSDSDSQKVRDSVSFPRHLKALADGCPPLTFGSFKCGEIVALLAPLQSDRDASRTEDVLSSRLLETRNIGFSAESLESLHNARKGMTRVRLNVVSSSGESCESEYIRPSQHEPNVQSIGHSAAELSFARTDPTLQSFQNQPAFNEPRPSSDLFTSKFNSLRISDSLEGQFPASQSIPSRLGNTVSSLSRIPNSFPVMRQPQPSISSYSKPNLPLEQPGYNSMSYQGGLLQSNTKLPSTFQQQQFHSPRYNFHQPSPDLKSLPLYEGPISRVPRDFGATGYGSYRESDNVPGSYRYSSTSSMVSNRGYNDSYRDLSSRQQNSIVSTWNNNGSSSRMQPSAQVIGYSSLRGQNQQYAGYRQDQERQSQYNNNGALGYSDLYRSQPEGPQDQQQLRNLGGSTVDPQDLSSQQFQQFWQNH